MFLHLSKHRPFGYCGILLLVYAALPASAATYYVDGGPAGNNSNPGTLSQPWKTIDHGDAAGLISVGDTVIVQPATYGQGVSTAVSLVTVSGVTYRANGPGVVINNGGATGNRVGILVSGHDIVIDGFEITGGDCGVAIASGSTRVTVTNCKLHDMGRTGTNGNICAGISIVGPNTTDCVVHDNSIYNLSGGTNHATGAWLISSANNCILYRNLVHDLSGLTAGAFDVGSCDNTKVYNNTVNNCTDLVRLWGTTNNTAITNNITANCTLDHAIRNEVASATVLNSYNLFYNNALPNWYGCSQGAGEFTADPMFVSISDYHLQPSSPAIDIGVDVGIGFNGPAPDLGVFESDSRMTKASLADFKSLDDGTLVSVLGANVVTAASGTFADGSYNIEDPGRTSGIKVVGGPAVALGDRVAINGVMGTEPSGERVITVHQMINKTSGTPLAPVGMNGRAVSATALDATGLLVRIWGRVKYRADDGSYVYIDDGSGFQNATGNTGMKVVLDGLVTPLTKTVLVDDFVTVTGLASLAKDGATAMVRTVRPRTDDDISISQEMQTGTDWNFQRRWMDTWFGPSVATRPFSFNYEGQSSAELLAIWNYTSSVRTIDANRIEHTFKYTDPTTKLEVRCVATEYTDYPAVEWVLYFKNTGSVNTPILDDILPLNTTLSSATAGQPTLYYADGFRTDPTGGFESDLLPAPQCYQTGITDYLSYQPKQTAITSTTTALSSVGGRSADGTLPFFNMAQRDGSGAVIGVGWTGQWIARFVTIGDRNVNAQAGMQYCHFKLLPGEEVRTPSALLLFWVGGDRVKGQNNFRRLLLDHYSPTPGGAPVVPPICAAPHYTAGVTLDDMNANLMLSCINGLASHNLAVDAWWIDAGWYKCGTPAQWVVTGNWYVENNPVPNDPSDPVRYPAGMKVVSDAAHANGYKFLLWFEPERAYYNTWLYNVGSANGWMLGNGGPNDSKQLNFGNPAALAWAQGAFSAMITAMGVDIYRQDCNGNSPLYYWQPADAADRVGITEIKYITGLYAFWDYLLAQHPNLIIDNCSSGGRRIDFEILKRSIVMTTSDNGQWEPMNGQDQICGLSQWIPITGALTGSISPYPWYSGLGSFITMAFDWQSANTVPWWTATKALIDKARAMRHLFLGDFYPLTNYSISPSVWVAYQFDRPDLGEGLIKVFRRAKNTTPSSMTFVLKGLVSDRIYRLTNDDQPGWSMTRTGAVLMQFGVPVTLSPGGAVILKYQHQ